MPFLAAAGTAAAVSAGTATAATIGTASAAAAGIGAGTVAAATAGSVAAGFGTGIAGAGLGVLAADLAILGTVISISGQIQAGKQAERNAEFNAQVQRNQAIREEQAAASEADIRQERGKKLLALQRVGFAKAGVGFAGTPLLVFEQTAADIAADIALTRFGGGQRAAFSRSRARLSLAQGASTRRASRIGAFGTLLSGGTQAIQIFQRFR